MKRAGIFSLMIVIGLGALASCGKDSSPTQPSQPTGPVTYNIAVTVETRQGRGIPGATITNVATGQTFTTSGNGTITLTGAQGTITLEASSPGCATRSRTVSPPGSSGETRERTFTLPTPSTFRRSGSGNTVFDMPRCVDRVRIRGTWNGNGLSNFIVRIDGRGVVNAILRQTRVFDGVFVTTGGVVETLSSTNISWTFTEIR